MVLEYEESINMVPQSPLPTYSEESQSARLARKANEAPFMPFALAGLTMACIYGAYKFKHRGTMSTSVFLMQLRVAAQGTVVACLTAGVGYTLMRDYVWKPKDSEKKD